MNQSVRFVPNKFFFVLIFILLLVVGSIIYAVIKRSNK